MSAAAKRAASTAHASKELLALGAKVLSVAKVLDDMCQSLDAGIIPGTLHEELSAAVLALGGTRSHVDALAAHLRAHGGIGGGAGHRGGFRR